MFSKKLYGARLREIRKKAHEKQTEIAALIGTRNSHISEIENGISCTTVEGLARICEHYNVSADYLLGLSDDPAPRGRTEPPAPSGHPPC